MPYHGMTPHISGSSLSAQSRPVINLCGIFFHVFDLTFIVNIPIFSTGMQLAYGKSLSACSMATKYVTSIKLFPMASSQELELIPTQRGMQQAALRRQQAKCELVLGGDR